MFDTRRKIFAILIALAISVQTATSAATPLTISSTAPESISATSSVLSTETTATTQPKIATTELKQNIVTPAKPKVIEASQKIAESIVTQLNKSNQNVAGANSSVARKSQNVIPPNVVADAMLADQPQGDISKTLQRRSQMAEGKLACQSIVFLNSKKYESNVEDLIECLAKNCRGEGALN